MKIFCKVVIFSRSCNMILQLNARNRPDKISGRWSYIVLRDDSFTQVWNGKMELNKISSNNGKHKIEFSLKLIAFTQQMLDLSVKILYSFKAAFKRDLAFYLSTKLYI